MSLIKPFYLLFIMIISFVTCQQFGTSKYMIFLQNLENDFMMEYGFEGNGTWLPNSTINQPCAAFLNAYAEHTSVFTRCLVENARPFRLCETCVKPYKKATTVFQDLNDKSNPCFNHLLGADRVQVIRVLNSHMTSLWSKADCENCVSSVTEDPVNGTVNVTLNNSTKEFQELFHTLAKCMNDPIEKPDEQNGQQNVSVCEKCRSQYRALNKHFDSIQDATMNHACMDVVDMMNYTRLIWSNKYHCSHRKGDDGPVLGIAIVICLLPIVFYVGHRFFGGRYNKTIVRQRRMHRPVESLYGSTCNSYSTDSRSTITTS